MHGDFRDGCKGFEIDRLPRRCGKVRRARRDPCGIVVDAGDDVRRFEDLFGESFGVDPFHTGPIFEHPVVQVETVDIDNRPHIFPPKKQRPLGISPLRPLSLQRAAGG